MIEVFITDIQTEKQAEVVIKNIQNENPDWVIHYDLNETEFPFPCGHTILRVEGEEIHSENIAKKVTSLGIRCEILEDKICCAVPTT